MKKKVFFSRYLLALPIIVSSLMSCQAPTGENSIESTPGISDVPSLPSPSLPSEPVSSEEEPDYGLFTDEDFLQVDGIKVRKNHGTGDAVILKGTNAGGYLTIESWMCAAGSSTSRGYIDHKKLTEIFVERFQEEKTLELWEAYRNYYWSEIDFENCYDMGMNCIRLPFNYMNVDPDYHNVPRIEGEKYNFTLLDDFVTKAARLGIYTILDMHGAYGSQNGQDHSGQAMSLEEVDFYTNEEKMQKTVDMWAAIAEHFKDNPAVAAYDILNEPGEKAGVTSKRHWDFFDRVYEAIREVDEQHIVVFESCWDGAHLPQPSEYGWENCMYSFHNYSGESDADRNLASMERKIEGVEYMNFKVPCYMGEFNCYGNEESWTSTLTLFARKGWHWTSWTYKLNRVTDMAYPGWGIYYTRARKISPDEDSYEDILASWEKISTEHEDTSMMGFPSGMSLKNIMKRFCSN